MCARAYSPGTDLGGGCRRCATPPPPPDNLRLSNTTAILQNMQICMICIFSSSHYVIAQSHAFFFVFTFKICLRHQQLRHSLVVHPLQQRIQGRGPGGPLPPPLIFRPKWGLKGRKKIFLETYYSKTRKNLMCSPQELPKRSFFAISDCAFSSQKKEIKRN